MDFLLKIIMKTPIINRIAVPKLVLLLTIVIITSSCGGHKNTDHLFNQDVIIQEDSLISIIKDIHIMDAAAKQNLIPNNSTNINKYKQYKTVLEKHQVSKMRFDSTINLYTKHGEKFDELYDKVIQKLVEEEEAQVKK
jgi:hypothetical protein